MVGSRDLLATATTEQVDKDKPCRCADDKEPLHSGSVAGTLGFHSLRQSPGGSGQETLSRSTPFLGDSSEGRAGIL
jgi:hypothetical protein